jgi:hypothetical protein
MKNVAFKLVGYVCICYYNGFAPTEQDHRDSIQFFRNLDFARVKILAITEGGAPSTVQRKDFNDALKGRQIPLALVTDSTLVRGAVTAYGWFNKNIRPFPRANLEDALAYLGVPEAKYEKHIRAVAALREEVNGHG